MTMQRWVRRAGLALALAGLAGPMRAAAQDAVPAEPPGDTRQVMQVLLDAFTRVVVLGQDEATFSDPRHREAVVETLRAMAGQVERLAGHAGGPGELGELERTHGFVGGSLGADVGEALESYRRGHYAGARFLVGQMAENCFACHSKLPAGEGGELGASLLERDAVQALPRARRAKLAVAARRFDSALALYEEMFAGTELSAVQIDAAGGLEDYLKIVLRVRDDRDRAVATLDAFRTRPDVPRYLDAEIAAWREALADLAPLEAVLDPMAQARAWIREGQLRTDFPGDQRGLVHFVLASSLLHRHLAARPGRRAELAEAFLLLGQTEAHISHSLWVSETEAFLENAIRTAPETSHARRAYATLEAFLLTGFTGSSGTHLPPEIEAWLGELRALLDAAATRETRAAAPAGAAP